MTEPDPSLEYPVSRVPKDPSDMRNLLATKPPMWEYLLFAASLYEGKKRVEPKWRDYHLGLVTAQGIAVAEMEVIDVLQESLSRLEAIVGNLDRLMTKEAQLAAFGAPGEPGDGDFIKHLAGRVIDMYEGLIDWATQIRSTRFPDNAKHMAELAADYAAQPIAETRRFIDDVVKDLERVMDRLVSGERSDTITLEMPIVFVIPEPVLKAYKDGLKQIVR
ncbi:hypothetical protein NtRootA4_37080 [Arthrobacter sp. NtRootA4]|nr:hypothetical protein NtRootA2_39290 [Arthrobacter sp. NtRootA2]BCW16729.1 hypothetical protein NtRootA4_37080 [Arthrobacter sp. NtRootA4]BCW25062.1 hypothetical protein NtRootC7_39290 [Arthrobacter sp. NtRootC7]BCW29331.1 hypothetical protein NtRootC45_39310 [Arthrobacter sp. NtRootC45]BCW33602.1 hypothetical protein NtRootD5_39330 [Arthrobacter sp. NtRootD5]